MKDKIKFGHQLLDIEIPEKGYLEIMLPREDQVTADEEFIVREALK